MKTEEEIKREIEVINATIEMHKAKDAETHFVYMDNALIKTKEVLNGQ